MPEIALLKTKVEKAVKIGQGFRILFSVNTKKDIPQNQVGSD